MSEPKVERLLASSYTSTLACYVSLSFCASVTTYYVTVLHNVARVGFVSSN